MAYCPNCDKETGHKRFLSFGTYFAMAATGGLWLIAILFYPQRCVICGSSKTTTEIDPEAVKAKSVKSVEEYQLWVEEFIYKFNKAITKVSSNPEDPVDDFNLLSSFFATIKDKSLDTASIKGLENKAAFEETLLKAQNLLDDLKANPQIQDYIHQQEQVRFEKERLEAEEVARAEETKKAENNTEAIIGLIILIPIIIFFLILFMGWK